MFDCDSLIWFMWKSYVLPLTLLQSSAGLLVYPTFFLFWSMFVNYLHKSVNTSNFLASNQQVPLITPVLEIDGDNINCTVSINAPFSPFPTFMFVSNDAHK